MKPPPEIEAKGLKAYEQVRAFEALQRRGLPWIYLGFSVMLWGLFFFSVIALRSMILDLALLTFAMGFSVTSRGNWMVQRARYAENLRLLEELKQRYGEELPWLQVERHLAALEELKRELAEEETGI